MKTHTVSDELMSGENMKGLELVSKVMADARMLEEKELEIFLSTANAACIAIMRGTYGDEYVNAYLTAALEDENPPTVRATKAH
jgi:hypothetical protein